MIDGALFTRKTTMKNIIVPEREPAQVVLGKIPHLVNPLYMAEVTVDELYFWESWKPNLEIWKAYTVSGLA